LNLSLSLSLGFTLLCLRLDQREAVNTEVLAHLLHDTDTVMDVCHGEEDGAIAKQQQLVAAYEVEPENAHDQNGKRKEEPVECFAASRGHLTDDKSTGDVREDGSDHKVESSGILQKDLIRRIDSPASGDREQREEWYEWPEGFCEALMLEGIRSMCKINVEHCHRNRQSKATKMRDVFEELATRDTKNIKLPVHKRILVSKKIHHKERDLRNVVTPGKIEDAGVVLLPMRQIECQKDGPENVQKVKRVRAKVRLAKYGINTERNQQSGPTVTPMVEQLS